MTVIARLIIKFVSQRCEVLRIQNYDLVFYTLHQFHFKTRQLRIIISLRHKRKTSVRILLTLMLDQSMNSRPVKIHYRAQFLRRDLQAILLSFLWRVDRLSIIHILCPVIKESKTVVLNSPQRDQRQNHFLETRRENRTVASSAATLTTLMLVIFEIIFIAHDLNESAL